MEIGVPCDEGDVAHADTVAERLWPNARVKTTWHDTVVYIGAPRRHSVVTDLHPWGDAPRLKNIHTHGGSAVRDPKSTPMKLKTVFEKLFSLEWRAARTLHGGE